MPITTDDGFIPGAHVVTWRGYSGDAPGRTTTIERVTKTQIITADGRRWNRSTHAPLGGHGCRSVALYLASDPRIAEAVERREAKEARKAAAVKLFTASDWWVNDPTEERTAALREGDRRRRSADRAGHRHEPGGRPVTDETKPVYDQAGATAARLITRHTHDRTMARELLERYGKDDPMAPAWEATVQRTTGWIAGLEAWLEKRP